MLTFRQFISESILSEQQNALLMKSDSIQKFVSSGSKLGDGDREKLLIQAYNELLPMFNKVKDNFEALVKKSIPSKGMSNRPTVLAQIKPLASVISKVVKRKKAITGISDLVRGAVLFDTKEQADDFIAALRRKGRGVFKGVESKTKGGDATFGYYGSHHVELEIMGLNVELQVMTKRMWKLKGQAHEIYDRHRENVSATPAYAKQNSKLIFNLANKTNKSPNKRLREELEEQGLPAFTLEEMEEFAELLSDFEDCDFFELPS